MKRNVATYARVSTEHEAQLSVLDNQVQYYDDILKKNPDWILYDRYIDEDITGTSTKKRKNFMRMIEDAKSERFDLIVIREVSRFARNTVDTLQETRKLKNIGVEVYFIDDNISNYNRFIGAFENSTIFFSLDEKEKKIINYVYDFYIKILNIIVCKDTEKQLFDTILNIPFIIDAFEDGYYVAEGISFLENISNYDVWDYDKIEEKTSIKYSKKQMLVALSYGKNHVTSLPIKGLETNKKIKNDYTCILSIKFK